jgi:hypothetical protein
VLCVEFEAAEKPAEVGAVQARHARRVCRALAVEEDVLEIATLELVLRFRERKVVRPQARLRDAGHFDRRREIVDREALAIAKHNSTLDRVLELAHVPRPAILHQNGERRGVNPVDRAPIARRVLADEVVYEKGNVV